MNTPTFNFRGLELIMRKKLTAAQLQIANNMRIAGKVATGNTIRNIRVETELTASGCRGSITAPMWSFITTETGRRGGKVPAGFRHIIYQWSLDKGIPFDKDYKRKSFAWCVAQKIAKNGTLQHRVGKRTDIYTDVVDKLVKELQAGVTLNDLFDINAMTATSEIFSIQAKL